MNGLICIVSVFNARHQSDLLMGKLFEFKSKALKLRILYKCHKYDCVILPYTLKISKKVSHAFHEKAPFPSESHAKQDVVQSSRPFHVLIRSCPFRVGIEFLKLSPMRIIGLDPNQHFSIVNRQVLGSILSAHGWRFAEFRPIVRRMFYQVKTISLL